MSESLKNIALGLSFKQSLVESPFLQSLSALILFFGVLIMSRVCQVTGRGPMAGNKVSHANNKTRRRFNVNLHTRKFWVPTLKRFITLKVSNRGLRTIDKLGIEQVLERIRQRGEKI